MGVSQIHALMHQPKTEKRSVHLTQANLNYPQAAMADTHTALISQAPKEYQFSNKFPSSHPDPKHHMLDSVRYSISTKKLT